MSQRVPGDPCPDCENGSLTGGHGCPVCENCGFNGCSI
jgi:hypothetical protein